MLAGARYDDEILANPAPRRPLFGFIFVMALSSSSSSSSIVAALAAISWPCSDGSGGLMLWEHYCRGGTILFAICSKARSRPASPPPSDPETPAATPRTQNRRPARRHRHLWRRRLLPPCRRLHRRRRPRPSIPRDSRRSGLHWTKHLPAREESPNSPPPAEPPNQSRAVGARPARGKAVLSTSTTTRRRHLILRHIARS